MSSFSIADIYKLELHWDKVEYNIEGLCSFTNAIFKGPALSIADKINNNDSIMIDFYNQYITLVKNVYVGKFSWGKVEYIESGILLHDAILSHISELNKVPKLNNNDYIVIDTTLHESDIHRFNPLYKAYVISPYHELYNFNLKE